MDPVVNKQLLNNPVVTNNIMSSVYNADANIKYRQLNKQIYNETGQFFYEKYCDLPISHKEIRDYLLTNPRKFGSVLATTMNNNGIQEIAINFNYYELSPFVNIIYYISTFGLDYHRENNTMELSNTINVDVSNIATINRLVASCRDYDLLTIYHVYRNRTNCVKVNKNYAKEKILEEFDTRFIVHDDMALFDAYYIYQYMLLNCYVLNMDETPRLMDNFVVPFYDIDNDLSDAALMDYFEDIMANIEGEVEREMVYFFVDEVERLKPLLLEKIKNL